MYIPAAWTLARQLSGHDVHVVKKHVACSKCHAIGENEIGPVRPERCAGCHEKESQLAHASSEAQSRFGAVGVPVDDILTQDVDVVAPCALGGTISEYAARYIRAGIVAGAANNQLATPEAGRILVQDWGRYDYGSALVRPANMSTDQMMDGFKYIYEGFYSASAIAKRLFPPPRGSYMETLAYLVANLKVNRYLRSHEGAWATIS